MLSDFDKRLLNAVQEDIPISSRPFQMIADELKSDEATVISRLRALMEAEYIRRVGAYFDSQALGYTGSLVALKVRTGCMEEVANVINRFDGITHNYEREGEYNLWFTLQSDSSAGRREVLDAIGALSGVEAMMELPSKKKYKIRVSFHLE